MAYKARRRGRKMNRRHKGYSKRKFSSRILRNPEQNYLDVATSLTPTGTPTSAGGVVLLNGIVQGSSVVNRTGNKVNMSSLFIKMYLQPLNTTGVCLIDEIRLALVYDKAINGGSLPVVTDIFNGRDSTGAVTNGFDSSVNLDNRARFIVLMDEFIATPQLNTPTTNLFAAGSEGLQAGAREYCMSRYIKLNLPALFKAATGTIADITVGSLYLVAVNRNTGNSSGTNIYKVSYNSRLRFTP